MIDKDAAWFITGCSKGLGQALARQALASGYKVVATARRVQGARAIITALEADQPPVHLIIGGDGLDQVWQQLTALQREFDTWEELTRSTDVR